MAKNEFARMSPERRRECGRKGGLKTKAEYKTKRSMAETLKVLLNMPLEKGKTYDVEHIRSFAHIKGKNITIGDALAVKTIQRALMGDLKAIEMVRDTIGEKPMDNLNITDLTPTIISGEDDISE